LSTLSDNIGINSKNDTNIVSTSLINNMPFCPSFASNLNPPNSFLHFKYFQLMKFTVQNCNEIITILNILRMFQKKIADAHTFLKQFD